MNKPDVSVIVTIHNSEKYLRACLDSVINQTHRNIEILCIDGGSTDSSPTILKEYRENDDRIRIINDKNCSYGHKINVGIDNAKGEYISIIESDDEYAEGTIEMLFSASRDTLPDVVDGDEYHFYDIGDDRTGYVLKGLDGRAGWKKRDTDDYYFFFGGIWKAIYKKSFLIDNRIKLHETPGASFQDQGFAFLISVFSHQILHIDSVVYYYRRDNETSSVYDKGKTWAHFAEKEFIKQELLNRGVADKRVWEEWAQLKYEELTHLIGELPVEERKEVKERIMEEIKKDESLEIVAGIMNNMEFRESILSKLDVCYYKEVQLNKGREYHLFLTKNYPLLKDNKLVIVGAGRRGRFLDELVSGINTRDRVFCDNMSEKYVEGIGGRKVLSVEDATNEYGDAVFIITPKSVKEDLRIQIESLGIKEEQVIDF